MRWRCCFWARSINIVLSRGAWLRRVPNLIALSAMLAATTLLRHNGVLVTLPLLMLLLALYAPVRLRVVLAGAAALAVVIFARGPLYPLLDVETQPQTYVESVGIPMTILGDIKMQNPGALDEETHEFLLRFATEEEWSRVHVLHDYNQIKWVGDSYHIVLETPPADLLRMTARAIRNDPRHAFLAVMGLTDMVWRTDEVESDVSVWIAYDIEADVAEMTAADTWLRPPEWLQAACERIIYSVFDAARFPLFRKVTTSLGVQILALLCFGMFSVLYRRKMAALIFVLPTMIYNLATMLLLSGNDYRLFSFNLVIIVPFALVCFVRQADEDAPDFTPERLTIGAESGKIEAEANAVEREEIS